MQGCKLIHNWKIVLKRSFEFILHGSQHHVNNEELYLVLKGNGKLTVDNKEYSLQEGSVAAVLPKGVRRVDAKEDGLIFICIQAKQGSLTACTLDDGKIC